MTVDLDGATEFLTRSAPPGDPHCTDAWGTRYYPILIDVVLSGEASGATVALVAGEAPGRTEGEVAGAISSFLRGVQ